MNSTTFQPKQYHSVTPYLICRDASHAIDYYQRIFGAREMMRMPGPNGRIMHAELQIGDARIMLADEFPDMNVRGPQAIGGTPVTLLVYVEDVDATTQQAIAAGAKAIRPVQDQFYGDRAGTITDPFGHQWTIATHKEDLTMEQLQERMRAMKPCPETAGAKS
jgi:PhnB protein